MDKPPLVASPPIEPLKSRKKFLFLQEIGVSPHTYPLHVSLTWHINISLLLPPSLGSLSHLWSLACSAPLTQLSVTLLFPPLLFCLFAPFFLVLSYSRPLPPHLFCFNFSHYFLACFIFLCLSSQQLFLHHSSSPWYFPLHFSLSLSTAHISFFLSPAFSLSSSSPH